MKKLKERNDYSFLLLSKFTNHWCPYHKATRQRTPDTLVTMAAPVTYRAAQNPDFIVNMFRDGEMEYGGSSLEKLLEMISKHPIVISFSDQLFSDMPKDYAGTYIDIVNNDLRYDLGDVGFCEDDMWDYDATHYKMLNVVYPMV